jgi:hypothetical protein
MQHFGGSADEAIKKKYGLTRSTMTYPEHCDELTAEIKRRHDAHVERMQNDPVWAAQNVVAGFDNFRRILIDSPQLTRGTDAILSAAVLGTWTAFETLTSDVWKTAINAAPNGLAELTGSPRRIAKLAGTRESKSDDDEAEAELAPSIDEDKEEKMIFLKAIQTTTGGNYNLSNKMGDLLRSRFRFISLRGIRRAYSTAFSERIKGHDTSAIDSALANKCLDALSLVRNIIVHNAGIATADYCRESNGVPTAIPLKPNEKLELDGENFRAIIDPTVASCKALVSGADTWISLTRAAHA